MSEEKAAATRRPERAWARRQETAATADTLSSLIGLQSVAFWREKIGPQVGVRKHCVSILLFCLGQNNKL